MQSPAKDQRPVILLIDNSVSFTGAFKCALAQAELMSFKYHYIFVLPIHSTCIEIAISKGFEVYPLKMVELKKNLGTLLSYCPALVLNARKVSVIARERNVYAIIMNDFYNLIGIFQKMNRKPVRLLTCVRFLPSAIPGLFRWIWTKAALTYSDNVIAVSEAVRKQLPASKKVIRIYDPVKLDESLPPSQFENERTTLLYVGNFIKGKGQDHALDAFISAFRVNSNLRLVFAGGDMGLEKNRLFLTELKEKTLQQGLEHAVEFLPFQPSPEALYRQADIFLNFSEAESFSMTCLEASFYGLPVIATRCGGPEEIIQHNKTGKLVGNKSVHEMENAILELAQDKEMQKRYGLEGKKYVTEKFSSNRFIQEMISVLEPSAA